MGQTFVAVRSNPMAAFRFNVQFASSFFVDAGFSRINGLDVSSDVIMYREGGQVPTARKFPGLTQYNPIRFERGSGKNMDMYNWAATTYVVSPDSNPLPDDYSVNSFRKNLVINGMDSDNGTVVRSWNVTSAWPSNVQMGDFDAQSSTVLIESMTVQHEGLFPANGPLGSGLGTGGVNTSGGTTS